MLSVIGFLCALSNSSIKNRMFHIYQVRGGKCLIWPCFFDV